MQDEIEDLLEYVEDVLHTFDKFPPASPYQEGYKDALDEIHMIIMGRRDER